MNIKDNDILLSFAKYFDEEYKKLGRELPVCLGKTIMSGTNAGKQRLENTNFIRIDESNFLAENLDVHVSAKAQLFPILIELFFKRENIYQDEKSHVNDILLGGITFKLYTFSDDGTQEYVGLVRVDAYEIDGANAILVNQDYQHYYWYVKVIRVFG